MIFLIEPLKTGVAPSTNQTVLDLHSTPSNEAKLINLIAGTANFIDSISGKKLITKYDYSILGAGPAKKGKAALRASILKNGIDIKSLDTLLKKSMAQNKYYEEIFDELARAIFFHQNKNQVLSFLHIYRTLERISYSFPVIYASVSNDYKGTFQLFKKLLDNKQVEELGFFKAFVKELIDASYLTSTVKVHVSHHPATCIPAHYLSLEKIFSGKGYIANQKPNSYIEIHYSAVISGLINLRNKYFHFLSGRTDNLTSREIPSPEDFFDEINHIFLNWISFIYFRILEARCT